MEAPPEPEATLMQQMQELRGLYIERRAEQDRLQREAMFSQQQAAQNACYGGMRGGSMNALQAEMLRAEMQCFWATYQHADHAAAMSKSLALLKQWLSPEQLAQYEKGRFIEVTGSASGRRYRIKEARMQNVYEIDHNGREIMGYCFGPEGAVAVGDVMLAQKIALETDEPAAMKVANKFGPFGMSAAAYVRMRERPPF